MNRRTFLRATGAAAGAALFTREAVWAGDPGRAELLLRGARIYDGTGAPPFEGEVAIAGGRIAAVGPRLQASGAHIIELRGLALAPGFIDIHSHTDLVLLINPRAESKIRQGVTTEVVGQDGSSIGPWTAPQQAGIREEYREKYGVEIDFSDLPGFFRRIDAQGAATNVASMIGQGTVRGFVVGEDDRPATAEELTRMREQVRAALAAGACGLSSGLEYTPGAFAGTAELAAVAEALRGTGLPYASHLRNEDDALLGAVEEAITIGRRAGVPVQISHLKAQGQRNWWKADPVLDTIASARAGGIDVMFDCYPYIAYSTGLANLFPVRVRDGGTAAFLARLQDPEQRPELAAAVREKIEQLGSWDAVQITSTHADALAWARGRRLGELAAERNEEPYTLLVRLIVEDENRTGMVGFGMSEENVARKLSHPLALVCSDGAAWAPYGPLSEGSPHPRTYGAFPRVLGHFCREQGVMPLEDAIHKMTGRPAARLRLEGRGRIVPGAFADLVAFDPDRVADRATFEAPHRYPEGIPHVLVGGVFVIQDGEHTGALPGRVVRPAITP
ncbi:MAG: D-aminoacylase [Gemmatimonadetes bacterium]|nr:D-aminoacylase [Gemmatimonadota bacterium]